MQGVSGQYCERHGVEKTLWNKNSKSTAGGFWVCRACRKESESASPRTRGVSAKEMEGVHSGQYCEKHPGVEKDSWERNSGLRAGGSWRCKKCQAEKGRKYYAEHPEVRAKYLAENPERRREVLQTYYHKVVLVGDQQITQGKVVHLRFKYQLTPQDVYELWEAQSRKCMFGGEPLAWDDIYIDHQHGYPGCIENEKTGQVHGCPKESVRGLACRTHNVLEGNYVADPKGYMAVARWHVEHNGGKWEDICS